MYEKVRSGVDDMCYKQRATKCPRNESVAEDWSSKVLGGSFRNMEHVLKQPYYFPTKMNV